ncbi:MAG: hypothetical protein GY759_10970 [Chloroflexi bacterium]|nr:hypothetical protein [Chloroflexota bacterium]
MPYLELLERSAWFPGLPVYRFTGLQVYRSTGLPELQVPELQIDRDCLIM